MSWFESCGHNKSGLCVCSLFPVSFSFCPTPVFLTPSWTSPCRCGGVLTLPAAVGWRGRFTGQGLLWIIWQICCPCDPEADKWKSLLHPSLFLLVPSLPSLSFCVWGLTKKVQRTFGRMSVSARMRTKILEVEAACERFHEKMCSKQPEQVTESKKQALA